MTTLELEQDLRRAATSADGLRTLREHLQAAVDNGADPDDLQERLEALYEFFLASGDDEAAELTADVVDLLVGWCGPHVEIRRAS